MDPSAKEKHPTKQTARPQTPQEKIPYLCLPPEIRNQIMREVLLIGDIPINPHPRHRQILAKRADALLWKVSSFIALLLATKTMITIVRFLDTYQPTEKHFGPVFLVVGFLGFYPLRILAFAILSRLGINEVYITWKVDKLSYTARAKSMHGFPFLAVCHQLRNEGRSLFFTQNRFFLPAGDVQDTITWLAGLDPTNKALIRNTATMLSPTDIRTLKIGNLCGNAIRCNLIPSRNHKSIGCTCVWNDLVIQHLNKIWREKSIYMNLHLGGIVWIEARNKKARQKRRGEERGWGRDEDGILVFQGEARVMRYVEGAVRWLRRDLENSGRGWWRVVKADLKEGWSGEKRAVGWVDELGEGKLLPERKFLLVASR